MDLERKATRKNARLGDTLIVSLPKEVSREHHHVMMDRFAQRITFGGRTICNEWEHIDKPDNPHFHVVLIDRDRITGKSVGKFGHSRSYRAKQGLEPNVTEWMRQQWEEVGNEVFSEFGYSLTFDRRSNLERGIEPAGQHRGYDNDNVAVPEPDASELPALDDNEPLSAEEDADNPGDEELAQLDLEQPTELSDTAVRVRLITHTVREQNYLNDAKQRLEAARDRYAYFVRQRDNTQAQAARHEADSAPILQNAYAAEQRLAQHQKANGKLKGMRLAAFGLEFKTSARKQAEGAQAEAVKTQAKAQEVAREKADYEQSIAILSAEATAAEKEAFARAQSLQSIYGDDGDIAKTERVYARTITTAIRGRMKDEKPLTADDVWQAFEDGKLTVEDVHTFALQTGDADLLDRLEESLEYERRDYEV